MSIKKIYLNLTEGRFSQIPDMYKEEFLNTHTLSNFKNTYQLALIVTSVFVLLILGDLSPNGQFYEYKTFLIFHVGLFLSGCVVIVLNKLKKLDTESKANIWHKFLVVFYFLSVQIWAIYHTITDQFINPELTAYVMGSLSLASLNYFKPKYSLILNFIPFVILVAGIHVVQQSELVLGLFWLNAPTTFVLCWVISIIISNSRVRTFLQEKEIVQSKLEADNAKKQVLNSVDLLAVSSNEFLSRSELALTHDDDITKGISQIAENIEEINASLNKVLNKVVVEIDTIANKVGSLEDQATILVNNTHNGERYIGVISDMMITVNDASSISSLSIDKLKQQSQEIRNAINLISGIAKKTNLLSLNASIEASRYGEEGKGFAVVATQMRQLAQLVTVSTNKISDVVDSFQDIVEQVVQNVQITSTKVEESVELTKKTKRVFDDMGVTAKDVHKNIINIIDSQKISLRSVEEVQGRIGALDTLAKSAVSSSDAIKGSVLQTRGIMNEIIKGAKTLETKAHELKTLE